MGKNSSKYSWQKMGPERSPDNRGKDNWGLTIVITKSNCTTGNYFEPPWRACNIIKHCFYSNNRNSQSGWLIFIVIKCTDTQISNLCNK